MELLSDIHLNQNSVELESVQSLYVVLSWSLPVMKIYPEKPYESVLSLLPTTRAAVVLVTVKFPLKFAGCKYLSTLQRRIDYEFDLYPPE